MKKIFFISFLIILLFLLSTVNAEDCYPIGQVEDDKYCDIDEQWKDQLSEGEECQNNFECLSGNCIEETCSRRSIKGEYEEQKSFMKEIFGLLGVGNGDTTTTTGVSSGGGGRTISIGDDYDSQKTFSTISPNRLYCLNINEEPIPITKVCFISNTQASNVKIEVNRELERTSTISQPEGLVYQYVTINTENLPDSYIEKADIEFRVPKNWLTQNNLKQYKVILQRNTNTWNILKPSVVAEDNANLYYNTQTPGFSWFAITSLVSKPTTQYVPPSTQQAECGDGIRDSGENCETCEEDVKCLDDEICQEGRCILKKSSKLWYLLIPLILIILILILFYIFKKQVKITKKEAKPIYREIKKEIKKQIQPKRSFIKPSNKFKNIRIKEGLKKAAVARAARISTSTLTKIEENKEVKELSKRAALRGLNSLIARRTGVKEKYSYNQVFLGKPIIAKKSPFPSKAAEIALKNYIRKALAAGMTKKRIKAVLTAKGWKEKQIEYIFNQLK